MKKKLITLAKECDFKTENEYLDYLIDSHINGNFSQCRSLFAEMKKDDQKKFIVYMNENETPKEIRDYYFNLL